MPSCSCFHMNEYSVSTVSKLIQMCWQSFSETDTESRLHWSNQMVDNWNVQRAEISNLSENNLVTALSVGRLTLLELVMWRSHQSSWKILFDGSRRIKSVYETLNSRIFLHHTNVCFLKFKEQTFVLCKNLNWTFPLKIFKPCLERF